MQKYFGTFISFFLFFNPSDAMQIDGSCSHQEKRFLESLNTLAFYQLDYAYDQDLFLENDKAFMDLPELLQQKYKRIDEILRIIFFISESENEQKYDQEYLGLIYDFHTMQDNKDLCPLEKQLLDTNMASFEKIIAEYRDTQHLDADVFTSICQDMFTIDSPEIVAFCISKCAHHNPSLNQWQSILFGLFERQENGLSMFLEEKSLYRHFFQTCFSVDLFLKSLNATPWLALIMSAPNENEFFLQEALSFIKDPWQNKKTDAFQKIPTYFGDIVKMLYNKQHPEKKLDTNSYPPETMAGCFRAISRNDKSGLEAELNAKNVSVNGHCKAFSQSLLHATVADLWDLPLNQLHKRKAILEFLLEKGADPSIKVPFVIGDRLITHTPSQLGLDVTRNKCFFFQDNCLEDPFFDKRLFIIFDILDKICFSHEKIALSHLKNKSCLFLITHSKEHFMNFKKSCGHKKNIKLFQEDLRHDQRAVSILHNAARTCSLPVIDYLHSVGFPMNKRDSADLNALHELQYVPSNRLEKLIPCFRKLLEYGCQIQQSKNPRDHVIYKIMTRLSKESPQEVPLIRTLALQYGCNIDRHQSLKKVLIVDGLLS